MYREAQRKKKVFEESRTEAKHTRYGEGEGRIITTHGERLAKGVQTLNIRKWKQI
jgi:hypothetical protein